MLLPAFEATLRVSPLGMAKLELAVLEKPLTVMVSEPPVMELDVPVRCRTSSCRSVVPEKSKPAALMIVPAPPFWE